MSENKQSGGWWKWIVAGLVLAAAGGGGWWYHTQHRPVSYAYTTVAVDRGELIQAVTATGNLNPVVNVQVGCQVSGTILTNYVDYNSQVKAGQLISVLDPRSYQAQVQQATADLANATASLELDQVQARRAAQLFTNSLISGSDYDTAIATLHQAEAQVQLKQAALDNARANLDYTKIYSPVDGVVITRAVDIGQTVAASFSTPMLFQIANDLTRMQIDASVAEADIGGLAEGQPVEFTVDAYPYRNFHGSVRQVRNQALTSNNVVCYDAVISVTNADYKLKPGMTANVSIIVAERESALKIPNAALRFRVPDGVTALTNNASVTDTNAPQAKTRLKVSRNVRTVYRLAGDADHPQLEPVKIHTGISDGIFTEVLDGLNEGDKIVTGAQSSDAAAASGGSSPFGGGFPRMR
jgi:HlyD family secretion protein